MAPMARRLCIAIDFYKSNNDSNFIIARLLREPPKAPPGPHPTRGSPAAKGPAVGVTGSRTTEDSQWSAAVMATPSRHRGATAPWQRGLRLTAPTKRCWTPAGRRRDRPEPACSPGKARASAAGVTRCATNRHSTAQAIVAMTVVCVGPRTCLTHRWTGVYPALRQV
jgi:hypothetical protein